MTEIDIKNRTKSIAISIALLSQKLPANKINQVYINQILRSSSSIGANYRAACKAKSTKDFIYKLQVVEEESDETLFFLELLASFNDNFKLEIDSIYNEVEVILKIIVTSIKTSQKKLGHSTNPKSKIQNQKCLTVQKYHHLVSLA